MKLLMVLCGALALAGCATVEMSSAGAMKGGDRLLVIQNDGYELLGILPLWSGNLTWNEKLQCVDREVAFFRNHSDTQHLYEMAKRIAEHENCDLVDVTFVDNYLGLNPQSFYGALVNSDTAISAVLRPRK